MLALLQALGPMTTRQIAEEMGYADFRTCHHLIRKNRDALHITKWFLKVGSPGQPEPVWAAGRGRDATKPAPASRQTVNARYRRKRKASLRHIPYPAWLTRPAC